VAEKKFLVDLNLSGNKAKNFRLEDYADNTAPTSNFVGRLIYTTNSTDPDRVEVYTGAGWEQVAYVSDAPVLDQDLVDIAALTGDGFLTRQSGTWAMDNTTYLTSTDLTGVVYETDSQTITNKTYEDPTLKDRVSFTNGADVETMYIEHSGTGTNRIISTDDISIRSQNGDVILYPGNDSSWGGDGGTGRAYVHWGNDATSAGIGNEIVTRAAEQILTNKTINDTLYFTNPSTIPNDGSLVINDTTEDFEITALSADLILGASHAGNAVVLSGNAGEFLNDPSDPDNQIATIGDLANDGVQSVAGAAGSGQILVYGTGSGPYTGAVTLKVNDTLQLGDSMAETPVDGRILVTNLEGDTIFDASGSSGTYGQVIINSGELQIGATKTSFVDDVSVEYLKIEQAYTGTARITATDDIAIRSTDGDILLYPGNNSGGIGKVYIGWGNANPDTSYGIANPENEIITVDYVTGFTNTLSAQQFRADIIDSGDNYYGGYTFKDDGGYDTGMFSTGDGIVNFYANADEVAHFNASTFTVDVDLVVTGDLTVNGTLTTLNTETVTVEDNILVLNGNVTGVPITNAGLEVERGDYTNASILWNETDNIWTVSTVKDNTDTAIYHSVARKYAATLSALDPATSFVVTHDLNTRDVIAQVYTVGSPYEQVETTIEYTSVNTITVKFNVATSGDYRVVVTG
jgi:hypothetical protein